MNEIKHLIINVMRNTSVVVIMILLVIACKKEIFQQKDELAESLSNYKLSYVGEGSALILGDTIVNIKTILAPGLPVLLKSPASGNVVVQGEIDTSLLSVYDELQEIKSLRFGKDAFDVNMDGLIAITEGLTQSTDSLKVNLKNAYGLKNNSSYTIPIRLKVVDGQAELRSKYMVLKMMVKMGIVTCWFDRFMYVNNFTNSSLNPPTFIAGRVSNKNINGISNGPEKIQFSAKISHELSIKTNIDIEVNNADTVILEYNEIKKGKFKPLPSGSYNVLKKQVSIESSNYTSKDSFVVAIDYLNLKELSNDSLYLLVLELSDDSDSDLTLNKDGLRHRAFIEVNQKVKETKNIIPGNPDLIGNEIDRTNWELTGNPDLTQPNFPLLNLLDGNINTIWLAKYGFPNDIILDMGKVNAVVGFKLVEQYLSIQASIVEFELYSSDDGENWNYEGLYLGNPRDYSSTVNNPSIRNVKFIKPVESRYFKFSILSGGTGTPAFSDLIGLD